MCNESHNKTFVVLGCEYGDRIRNCQRYVNELGLSYVCSRYGTYCCGICNALAASTNNVPDNAIASTGPVESPVIIAPLDQGTGPSVSPDATLPIDLGQDTVISAGGQRRGMSGRRRGFETGLGRGRGGGRGNGQNRGRGKAWRSRVGTIDSTNQSTPPPNASQVGSAQNSQARGRFVPVRTFVIRPASPRGRGRGPPSDRRPRGASFVHRNILPNVNLVITSSGRK